MLRNISKKQSHNLIESTNAISSKFEKIVSFIEWSEIEAHLLFKFQDWIRKQIKLSKEELGIVFIPLKIDRELKKNLIRMTEEIEHNLTTFFSNKNDVSYLQSIEKRALSRVNLLMRTSSQHVRLICDSISFLHFVSCNMDFYSKIIQWFEKKDLFNRLNEWEENVSCILKEKVLTTISAIYIKYNCIASKAKVIKAAVSEREKLLLLKFEQFQSVKSIKSQKSFNSSQALSHNESFKVGKHERKRHTKPQSLKQRNQYQNLTIYLRFKLVQSLILKIQNDKDGESNQARINNTQLVYEIMILITKYIKQAKSKAATFPQLSTTIDSFVDKMNEFEEICHHAIKNQDQKHYTEEKQLIIPDEIVTKSKVSKATQNKSVDSIKNVDSSSIPQLKSKAKSEVPGKYMDDSKKQSNTKRRAFSCQNIVQQQLKDKFFKNIENSTNSRQKSKSAKAFLRDRSKSKIMAKILANTFENAKNALKQIEFQIKANNLEKFYYQQKPVVQTKARLVKKRKQRNQFYEEFSSNKQSLIDICYKKLQVEMEKDFQGIAIWNPIARIEQNKKCILQHKVIYKDHHNILMEGNSHQQNINLQVQSKLQFVKYISSIPQIISICIKSQQKSYKLKFSYSSFDQKQIKVDISLPKSNNIFTGRYQTIWPTIKYLLRKKIMQNPIFKIHQYNFSQWKSPNQNEIKRVTIKEQKLINLFGPIDEDQLQEISSTLGILSKFFDMLLCYQMELTGRKYELGELLQEKEYLHGIKIQNSNICLLSTKGQQEVQQKSIDKLKQSIWLNSRYQMTIGKSILKQRGCRLNLFNSYLQNPFFMVILTLNTSNIESILNGEAGEMVFNIKIFSIGLFESYRMNDRRSGKDTENQIKSSYDQCLYEQQIMLTSDTLTKYSIDRVRFLQNINYMAKGTRLDWQFYQKIMQLCWIHFTESSNFHTTFFDQILFPEIPIPAYAKISSEQDLKIPSLPYLDPNIRYSQSITICENVLQFNVDHITKTDDYFQYSQCTKRALDQRKKISTFPKNKITNKPLVKNPSINCMLKKRNLMSPAQESKAKPQQNIRFYRMKKTKNEGSQKIQREVVEIKFLTPYSLGINWMIQIKIVDVKKYTVHKIILSAYDLFSLGFPIIENFSSIYEPITQLIEMIEINKKSLVPKLYINAPAFTNQQINISIEGIKKKTILDHSISSQNHKEYDESIMSPNSKQNQMTYNFKYRSIYHSKRNRKGRMNCDRPYFETTGSLSQPKTYGLLRQGCNQKKRRESNQSLMQKACEKIIPSLVNYRSGQIQRGMGLYLVQLYQFQWVLSTVPVKLQLLNTKTDKRRQIFCLLSCKYINFIDNNEKQQDEIEFGIFELEVSIGRTQYTLVAQIQQQQFVSIAKMISSDFGASISKHLVDIKGKPKQKTERRENRKLARRYSIKSKQHKDLLRGTSSPQRDDMKYRNTDRCRDSGTPQKLKYDQLGFSSKRVNRQDLYRLTKTDKQNLKKLLLDCCISKHKSSTTNDDECIIIQPKQIIQCNQCLDNMQTSGQSKASYYLQLRHAQIKMKLRLYHEYDSTRRCIFDIYMHSEQWEIGTGVNSGIGLGAQVQIAKIQPEDHLQLIKIMRKSRTIKNESYSELSNINLREKYNQLMISQPSQISYAYENQMQGLSKNWNSNLQFIEIANIRILDLIRQYKLEHVESTAQLQPHFYQKNTILLTKLATYMMDYYVRGIRSIKRNQM